MARLWFKHAMVKTPFDERLLRKLMARTLKAKSVSSGCCNVMVR
jgi:hypothetical protein